MILNNLGLPLLSYPGGMVMMVFFWGGFSLGWLYRGERDGKR